MNETEKIEELLRKAPRLNVPPGLRQKIEADVVLPAHTSARTRSSFAEANGGRAIGWRPTLKRWIPALCFTAIFLACLVAIAAQSNLLSELRRENESLRISAQNLEQLRLENEEYQKLSAETQQLDRLLKDNAELQSLLKEVVQLRQQAEEIPALRTENQRLLAEKKAAESKIVPNTQGEEDPFGASKSRAQSIACINRLKQIGLAARIWSNDHKDIFPTDFLSMSNELNTPKILVCSGDTSRAIARTWSEFSPANVSYEFLSPGAPETDPSVVLFRCPIHNNVGLADGSAQMLGADRKVVQQDGKWVIGKASPPH